MSANAMSLKAKIRSLAKQKSIPAQVILQNYMFERFLVRLSASVYKDKFILKGGMLVAAIVGLENRATMDLDTTIKDLPLTPESIKTALQEIIGIDMDDEVTFTIGNILHIRDNDVYGGYRVMISVRYETILTPLSIDVSTGDVITPRAVNYIFRGIFDDALTFDLWAYNIETVMAEKVETILSRSVFNTRPRDFYDVYILCTTQQFDKQVFRDAFCATAVRRGTAEQIRDIPSSLKTLTASNELRNLWDGFRRQFAYAEDITYDMIIGKLTELLN
ncbi:MAG: hypothetical protein BWY11_01086 [Firmicutes bacterium ADurb.Bin182]|nr:MAG: hypothetical protein BWY11_01086 [Firmicutes bacterium ADurb.Bin182]